MILKIDKLMFDDDGDCVIRFLNGEIFCTVAKIANGYYIYNKNAEQIAQMLFYKKVCDLVMANPYVAKESSYVMEKQRGGELIIRRPKVKKRKIRKFIRNLERSHQENVLNKDIFKVVGDFENYNYDIYRNSETVGNILPDSDDCYFKLRVNQGGNIVRLLMIALAVDRMTFEKKRKRAKKHKLFTKFYRN